MMYGETCPACGNEFNIDDDIVVCPICGTPHHRACWNSTGKCVNEPKHSEDFAWEPEMRVVLSDSDSESKDEQRDNICPYCESKCPENALSCPSCGAMLGEGNFGKGRDGEEKRTNFGFDDSGFLNGVEESPDADIGGASVRDAAVYMRIGAKRYIPKFMRAKSGKKIGWNWAALVFAPYWFFFRKMYKTGAVLLGIVIAVMLAMDIPLSNALVGVDGVVKEKYNFELTGESTWEDFNEYYSYQAELLTQAVMQRVTGEATLNPVQTDIVEWYLLMLSVNLGVLLAVKIFSALTADGIYRKKVVESTKSLRKISADVRTYKLLLMQKGGFSIFAAFASYYAPTLIMNLFSGII